MIDSGPASSKPRRRTRPEGRDTDGYTLLRETSRLISSVPDISVLLELLYEEIRKLIAADTYYVTLYDPRTDEVSVEVLIDEGQRFPRTRRRITTSLTRWIIDNRKPLLVRDMEHDPLPCAPVFMGKPRMSRSWLGVPMLLGDRVVGVLVAASYAPGAYTEAHQEILLHVANQAAVAIENARLYQETQQRVRELDALQRVSLELVSSLDVAAVIRLVVRTALELTGANDAHVFLYDEATGRLSFGAALWATGESDLRPQTTPRPDGLTMTCVRTGKAIFIHDCTSHPLFLDPAKRGEMHSIVSIPLRRAAHVLGALNIAFVTPHVFGDDEMRLLGLLADQAAIAIDNARLFQAAQERADRLAAVSEIAKAITGSFDLKEIVAAVSRSLMPLLPHEHMCLWQHKAAEGGWVAVSATEETAVALGEALESLVCWDALTAPLVWTADARPGDIGAALASAGLGTLVAVPVLADGECVGLWTVGTREAGALGPAQLELLNQVSGHLAIAIQNARLYSEMEDALERLRESQTQLVRSERMRALAELSAGVAHDFNNVLTSILGRVQLMLTHVQDPTVRESLQVIERAARNGAQTVRRIMGFARHREGEDFAPLDVNRLVEDAILLTEPRWRDPVSDRPAIDVKFRRGRPMTVMGSAAELSEVLTNLIFNAVDAMPAGGRLLLETRREGDEAVIRVQDTGVGIPPELMARLFTPFFTTKGSGNAGMGLSVAREIVARHGGAIRVESTVGKGSTFSVHLPIARHVQPHEFKEQKELHMTQPTQIQRNLSILVVEDEESIRRLLASILGLEGHEVRTFRTASEGIAAFAQRQADLVITDLGLPDQSGWEVARQIKAASPQTPVILITGWGVSAEVTEARRRGVDYILPKPFEFEELSELISKALGDLGQR